MAVAGSFLFSHELGICKNNGCNKHYTGVMERGNSHLLSITLSSSYSRQIFWSIRLSNHMYRPHWAPYRYNVSKCHSSLVPGKAFEVSRKAAVMIMTRSYKALQHTPTLKFIPAVGIIVFSLWGLGPLLRQGRIRILHKNDNCWRKSSAYYVMSSYLQPLLLWAGAILICRALEPVILPSDAGQIVKHRLLNFVGSFSTVLAFAYCFSCLIQQAQRFSIEVNGPADTRNVGFQFAGKIVYSSVWVAAVSLFMELLGFSTQKWITAGGLGTVLLTLAGREIFTNFLSSAMIHATRPFVVNEWIQTNIEGYELSGTVERVGWWSPTIVRGEDREAVHIPNHKFTMNVVRNITQKTHWRIKTHLAISHLDVNKINNIVADMRKLLAKNPQVEQQKLHRRVFLDNVNPENQALMILISCFVKTSHHEEYLSVKDTILMDLLRVISHHRARLATPIRTVQKIYSDDLENVPFADTMFKRERPPNRSLLLTEPTYKIHGDDKTKTRATRTNSEQDSKVTELPTSDNNTKTDTKSDVKSKEILNSENDTNSDVLEDSIFNPKSNQKVKVTLKSEISIAESKVRKSDSDSISQNVSEDSIFDPKSSEKVKPTLKSEISSPDSKVRISGSDNISQNALDNKQPKKRKSGNSEKLGNISFLPQLKQEVSRSSLEENICLKRALPIQEVTSHSPCLVEVKELAAQSDNF